MRVVSIEDQKEEAAFALKAAQHMREHRQHYTYAEGDPKSGKLLAIRWNSFTILVVRLHEDHVPACYSAQELLGSDLPTLQPNY